MQPIVKEPKSMTHLYAMLAELRARVRMACERGKDSDHFGEPVTIAGAWRIDEFGQQQRVLLEDDREKTPKDVFPEIPAYLNDEDLKSFLYARGVKNWVYTLGGASIPPAHVHCEVCDSGWTLDNLHDVLSCETNRLKLVSLKDFAGLKLCDAAKQIAAINGAEGDYRPVIITRNDQELRLEEAWKMEIEAGDSAECSVLCFHHRDCHRKYLRINARKDFQAMFVRAGYVSSRLSAIRNQYCDSIRSAPWFRVKTPQAQFVVGARTRVYELILERPNIALDKLFHAEDVTKGKNYIHAWSDEKLVQYLRQIRESNEVC